MSVQRQLNRSFHYRKHRPPVLKFTREVVATTHGGGKGVSLCRYTMHRLRPRKGWVKTERTKYTRETLDYKRNPRAQRDYPGRVTIQYRR